MEKDKKKWNLFCCLLIATTKKADRIRKRLRHNWIHPLANPLECGARREKETEKDVNDEKSRICRTSVTVTNGSTLNASHWHWAHSRPAKAIAVCPIMPIPKAIV